MRRSAQQDDVAGLDHMAVGIDADKPALQRHVNPLRHATVVQHAFQAVEALLQPIAKSIAHRDEANVRPRLERLRCRPRSRVLRNPRAQS